MARFVFVCPEDGFRLETPERDPAPVHQHPNYDCAMRRDWKAEGVGVGSGVRVSRDGTLLDQAHLFLPDNNEFKGPGDPDGTKGMRAWHERHAPAEGNKNPVHPGRVDRRVF